MCGIFCFLSDAENLSDAEIVLQSCVGLLENRGPNCSGRKVCDSRLLFYGSVLWHQGKTLCRQPVETDETILLFNGDIFQARENTAESDTLWLLDQVESCQSETDLCRLFAELRGPFSVIFYRKRKNKLYFARDAVGRNSLLFGRTSSRDIFITSVSGNVPSNTVYELPPCGLYCVDLNIKPHVTNLFPWTEDYEEAQRIIEDLTIAAHIKAPEKLNNYQYEYDFHTLLHDAAGLGNNLFEHLAQAEDLNRVCDALLSALRESVKERILNTTKSCKVCLGTVPECAHAKVGILFSGGIDCTILALLADEFVPADSPIELLNVAFEKVNRSTAKAPIDWNVPDRVTGLASVEELRLLRSDRKWNFVAMNVTRSELEEHRKTIATLVYPLLNVLDESLGAALWFASKGVGMCNGNAYTTHSRVLLLGSGADELFGGYTRHRAAFERCLRAHPDSCSSSEAFAAAQQALEGELNLDWKRLPSRNLARDDRVISDNGVTPRTPYLQEDFIAIVRSLKASQRCYHPLGPGIGDKLILRICAYKLGLAQACTLRKRALQFGCRIADHKQNASDKSTFLEL